MSHAIHLPSRLASATLAAGLLAGCSAGTPGAGDAAGASAGEALTVYATTGYLADAVATIAPDAEVTTMVGPGGDPHTYQPSTADIQAIRSADVVLWNGLHLEAQMDDQLASLGDVQLAVGEAIPEDLLLDWPERDEAGNALHDPHIWNSPQAWSLAVEAIADHLATLDPDGAATYRANAAAYTDQIDQAAQEAQEALAGIPEPRILITGHDAFAYFGDTFDLQVHATDFVSTEAALSAGDLSALADLIAEHEVPVIFQDNQANPQAITSLREAVVDRGWDVEIATEELYADSLGAQAGVDTYLGVFRHNADAVARALGGTPEGEGALEGTP
ncbi:metal ABC transporter solute-binding protein, Zn/Mn family [Serinibacter salmoneus]|uniref:Manganese/zinc/iron transport system substrate-binding protein n=1 Tax=Serinibacter salmoneus TaxID=556530 RepID=A0A2A9CXW6_9MICO|nr:zinc ABC transporter substrate-binding protein [Serinibacter salmoneus]PFG19274.1 manganese/zinc/iron transport system substrate-binding protein [Serinibacter salmoneus]